MPQRSAGAGTAGARVTHQTEQANPCWWYGANSVHGHPRSRQTRHDSAARAPLHGVAQLIMAHASWQLQFATWSGNFTGKLQCGGPRTRIVLWGMGPRLFLTFWWLVPVLGLARVENAREAFSTKASPPHPCRASAHHGEGRVRHIQ